MISKDDIRQLCQIGENAEVEFKSAKGGFPKSFWETFSAFANTNGGTIVLGIKQKEDAFLPDYLTKAELTALKKIFWDTAHNRSKVSQSLLEEQDITTVEIAADSYALVFRVPRAEYSKRPVYLTENPLGHTYKRKHEGDYVCSDEEVRQMFADANIQRTSTDARILRGYTMNDINIPTLEKYRREYDRRHENHPWSSLNHELFLKSIGAYRTDKATGAEGFTMAGILMFGKTDSITDPECLPYFFPDYREHLGLDPHERWSDRIYPDGRWEANLYEFYLKVQNKLFDALPTPFRMDDNGNTRIEYTSAHIATREALANACIHAMYSQKSNIVVERWPHRFCISNPGQMLVSISQFYEGKQSVCRNPILQKMFVFLGIGEKAGSGADAIVKGWEDNHWSRPEIAEYTDPERVEIVMTLQETQQENAKTLQETQQEKGDTQQVISLPHQVESLLLIIGEQTLSAKKIMGILELSDRGNFVDLYLHPAQNKGYVEMTHPENAKHRNQKYYLTEKGLELLTILRN